MNRDSIYLRHYLSLSCALQVQEIEEGKETDEFWSLLGGKAEYAKPHAVSTALPCRLFHCYNYNGKFQVKEIPDFGQSDFFEDGAFLSR